MKEFVILTDNGSDLSEDLAKKNEIEIMYLTVNVNDEEYDGINKKISPYLSSNSNPTFFIYIIFSK